MFRVNVDPTNLFQALSDRTRLRIVRLLSKFPKEEVCLCEISESLLEPEYNISKHVRILKQVGMLSAFKEGRWVYHKLMIESPLILGLCEFVVSLPDTDGIFKDDAARLKRQIRMREKARCTGSEPPEMKAESSAGKRLIRNRRTY